MNIKSFIITTAVGIMLAACQSNTYQIKGTVEGADIDTLYLTTDFQTGTPSATILVKNGKFEFNGEADSTYICFLYSNEDYSLNIPLFIEPGTIKVKLSTTPGASCVGGTYINDEWQRLSDSTMVIGKEINDIAEKLFTNEQATEADQQQAMEKVEKLNKRFGKIIVSFAERNIDNELACALLTSYSEEELPNEERLRLINMLPAKKRQRPYIQAVLKQLENTDKTQEGATIADFTMPSIEGKPMSIMSEVKKNRITILDFWASWCAPCRQEMPHMLDLYKHFKDKGLGIVGISLDDDGDSWKLATEQMDITWPQMSDLKGWECEAAQLFGVQAIPHTIVVDQNGKILRRGLRGQQLEEFIAEQLKP